MGAYRRRRRRGGVGRSTGQGALSSIISQPPPDRIPCSAPLPPALQPVGAATAGSRPTTVGSACSGLDFRIYQSHGSLGILDPPLPLRGTQSRLRLLQQTEVGLGHTSRCLPIKTR